MLVAATVRMDLRARVAELVVRRDHRIRVRAVLQLRLQPSLAVLRGLGEDGCVR